jgi:non-heme chloroperoxidase
VKSASKGIPLEVFNRLRSGLAQDRSQFWKDFAVMFYGANRPGAKVSHGMLDRFWLWSMQGGLKNVYDSIKAFSETDFQEDLKKFDVPTLVMAGEDHQIVPIDISGKGSRSRATRLWNRFLRLPVAWCGLGGDRCVAQPRV